jgi:hypothetical protein
MQASGQTYVYCTKYSRTWRQNCPLSEDRHYDTAGPLGDLRELGSGSECKGLDGASHILYIVHTHTHTYTHTSIPYSLPPLSDLRLSEVRRLRARRSGFTSRRILSIRSWQTVRAHAVFDSYGPVYLFILHAPADRIEEGE